MRLTYRILESIICRNDITKAEIVSFFTEADCYNYLIMIENYSNNFILLKEAYVTTMV